ncbi:hypothetical protein [Flavobacterium sp. UBA7682]|uniref:hypothetical protein n=1 Tax=Flavobacterium sp. UBA7682 TaxID=1946560 RepID=UPI0025C011EB|nr:hypothetical protein [Flavobacterium sp. UBA7682]
MKNSSFKNILKNNLSSILCLILLVGFAPTSLYSQDYRYINAYMDDFGKNEMFIKKSLMDYSVTIVETQLASRSKATAGKIVEKLESINANLRNNNKGFENNTLLRDSFIKMNQKTIESLLNGSLILNDYDYQSTLSLAEIGVNFNQKEKDLASYYDEMKSYEKNKKAFGTKYNINFKSSNGKNVLEYNAYQNILFYKINVIDQKLTTVIKARDKKGFTDCLNSITVMHEATMVKTTQYNDNFKDNTLNNANIKYSNFINGQKAKFANLFNEYVDEHNALQVLKNSNASQTNETVANYNKVVRNYNAKKNSFYEVYNTIQSAKKILYDSWFVTNGTFLKNNGEFENIHSKYVVSE